MAKLVLSKEKPIIYNMKEIKRQYPELSSFDGNLYVFIEEKNDHSTVWNIDGDDVILDRYDSQFGFPFYLRQIYKSQEEV